MKKVLFTLVAAAMILVGCEKDPVQTSNITSLSLEEAVTILAGDEEVTPLTLSWEPATETLDYSKVQWTSSDEAVVTVDADGGLLGIAKGEAIVTAAYEGLTATCAVTVLGSAYETITWDFGVALQSPTGMVHPGPFVITAADGSVIDTCGLALSRCPIFSDGFYVDGEGYITGAGYMANAYTLVYCSLADGGIYGSRQGYELIGSFDKNPFAGYGDCCIDDIKYYILPQGIIDEEAYGTVIEKAYILGEEPTEEDLAAYDAAQGYGDVFFIDYVNQVQYVTEGFLGEGYYFEPRTEDVARHYDFTINWFTTDFGFVWTEDGTGLAHPFTLSEPLSVRYTVAAAAPASALKPAHKGTLMFKQPEQFKANAVVVK